MSKLAIFRFVQLRPAPWADLGQCDESASVYKRASRNNSDFPTKSIWQGRPGKALTLMAMLLSAQLVGGIAFESLENKAYSGDVGILRALNPIQATRAAPENPAPAQSPLNSSADPSTPRGFDAFFTKKNADSSEPASINRSGTPSQDDFLRPDQAFQLDARLDRPDSATLSWTVAKGYYLYKQRISVKLAGSPGATPPVQLGALLLPHGTPKHDEFFGDMEVYHESFEATVPIARAPGAVGDLSLDVTYQGCAEAGLCYPPVTKTITFKLTAITSTTKSSGEGSATSLPNNPGAANQPNPSGSEVDRFARLIRDGSWLTFLAVAFAVGVGLSFTPCVLPMIPILSGIIAGSSRDGEPVTTRRAFTLSLAYVLGMALTYTVAGAAFAAAGQQAQAMFQKPWILILFAGLFVVLATAMFGAFELQMPAAIQSRVATLSNNQRAGTVVGTAIMGALSSLIVTACVGPVLVAALIVIGQSGDVARGAAALFSMSLGMGLPLLIIGTSAGALLPKAGAWMNAVKAGFGFVFLGVALWMIDRLLSDRVAYALWGLLLFAAAFCLFARVAPGRSRRWALLRKEAAVLGMAYALLILAGAAVYSAAPFDPRQLLQPRTDTVPETALFKRVKTVADLDAALAAAGSQGKAAMLDFYADWCVSCKEMEKYVFGEPAVRAEFEHGVLLQADVTANDADDMALLHRFGIFGPPTIVFFDPQGHERSDARVVGFMAADAFRIHVHDAFQ